MKIDLYIDLPPAGTFNPHGFYYTAYSGPSPKIDGWTRLKVSVNIPEHYTAVPYDGVAPVESVNEVDQ